MLPGAHREQPQVLRRPGDDDPSPGVVDVFEDRPQRVLAVVTRDAQVQALAQCQVGARVRSAGRDVRNGVLRA
jgi:hypothetical protein